MYVKYNLSYHTDNAQRQGRATVRITRIVEYCPERGRDATIFSGSHITLSVCCQGSKKVRKEYICSDALEQASNKVCLEFNTYEHR